MHALDSVFSVTVPLSIDNECAWATWAMEANIVARGGHAAQSRAEDTGETRQVTLRAAHGLFMANGYRAVSTRQYRGRLRPDAASALSSFQRQAGPLRRRAGRRTRYDAPRLERIAARSTGVGERLRQASASCLPRDKTFADVP